MISRSRKKGFTLVELIATIVLIAVIGAIIIFNVTNISSTNRDSEYERFVAAVKSAAQVYADQNPDIFDSLYVNKAFVYITVGDLIEDGLLDENLKNPYTEKRIGAKERIKGNLDTDNGALTFEYPVNGNEEESFLVALSDYIVWGEPYDCMTGAGSYLLALSDEEGNLTMLNDEATIKKYNLTCSLPSNFQDYYDESGKKLGKYTDKAGNYDVIYSWVTESGTAKKATRTLKVLAKVNPTFRTNYEYDFEKKEWFEPSYNTETKSWKYLTITPAISGGDEGNTEFRIFKQANNPVGKKIEVTNGWTNEIKEYVVDDGDKTYSIETIVHGHHYKDYTYTASGSEVIRQELIIPSSFITGGNDTWMLEKEFAINDTYSPVGVAYYEYSLEDSNSGLSKNLKVESSHTFNRTQGITTKFISVINNKCINELEEYPYIFFRAINKDGYVGKWSAVKTANLTNQLSTLVTEDSKGCSTCGTCCVEQNDGSCYYCGKTRYVLFGGKKFILLDKDKVGNIVAAFDGLSNDKVTPTAYKNDTWSIITCDGTFSKNYKYSSPVLQNIIDEGNNFLDVLPDRYDLFLNYKAWESGYSAYVGTVTQNTYKKYGNALLETKSYWTTDTYSEGFTIYVDTPYAHGNSTTKYNTYFYAIENGKLTKAYAGSDAYVKPLVEFKKNVYVCGGNGTESNPYVIATN